MNVRKDIDAALTVSPIVQRTTEVTFTQSKHLSN